MNDWEKRPEENRDAEESEELWMMFLGGSLSCECFNMHEKFLGASMAEQFRVEKLWIFWTSKVLSIRNEWAKIPGKPGIFWELWTDFIYVTSVRANCAEQKVTGYRFTTNKLHGIWFVHRIVYSSILIPAFSAGSAAFSDTGSSIEQL